MLGSIRLKPKSKNPLGVKSYFSRDILTLDAFMWSGGNWLKSCWDVEADPPSWGCAKREVSRGFPSREVRDVQPAESLQACCLLLHFIATGATHQPTFVCERSFKHEKSVWNIGAYISQHNETHSKVTHTCTHLHQNHLFIARHCETPVAQETNKRMVRDVKFFCKLQSMMKHTTWWQCKVNIASKNSFGSKLFGEYWTSSQNTAGVQFIFCFIL